MSSSIDEDFNQKTASFLKWFKLLQGATTNPKIEIADLRNRNAGRGIVALSNIEHGEELFSIRHSDILAVWNSALCQQIPTEIETMDKWMSLILTMIYEDGQEEKSKWWQYLKILPEKFDTLMYWSPIELAELQASPVIAKIGKDDADSAFSQYLLPVVRNHAGLFGKYASAFEGPNAEESLLAIAHRMGTLIMAYAFDLESKAEEESYDDSDDDNNDSLRDLNKAMVPFADIFNADGELMNAYLEKRETSLAMIASKPIRKGQEILNDYGQRPRSDLLRRYGYITNNARKWDVVELSIASILEVACEHSNIDVREKGKRLELINAWQVYEDSYDLYWPNTGDSFEFDAALLLVIHAFTMDQKSVEQELSLDDSPYDISLNLDMALVIEKLLSRHQNAYDTSIAEDASILRNPQVQGRLRMAIEVRLGEKELLAAALDMIKKRIRDLDPEYSVLSKEGSVEGVAIAKRKNL